MNFPSELEEQQFAGNLYGFYHPDSNEYNVISWGESQADENTSLIGKIVFATEQSEAQDNSQLLGVREATGLTFKVGDVQCKKQSYSLLLNIFSRNTGILESDVMLNKSAIISGCGSVGSLVALELAKAGVGNFVLIDNDTIAYHNLCRHQCGVKDVGKFKVNAVKERILQINPSAQVTVFASILEDIAKEVFDEHCRKGAIIIGCADNRESDVYANQISCFYKVPFISIGLWQRAFAGEIFYCIPEETPCYLCSVGNQGDGVSGRTSVNRRFYITEDTSTSSF